MLRRPADSLERHLGAVDSLKEQIANTERRAEALVDDARSRVAGAATLAEVEGVRVEPTLEDQRVAHFTPPPPGHRDWLTVELPGLR